MTFLRIILFERASVRALRILRDKWQEGTGAHGDTGYLTQTCHILFQSIPCQKSVCDEAGVQRQYRLPEQCSN